MLRIAPLGLESEWMPAVGFVGGDGIGHKGRLNRESDFAKATTDK